MWIKIKILLKFWAYICKYKKEIQRQSSVKFYSMYLYRFFKIIIIISMTSLL